MDANIRTIKRSPIKAITQLDNFDDEYVYDIGINNETPYFFANNILVHNSIYFGLDTLIEEGDDEGAVIAADVIAEQVNSQFFKFMQDTYNCNKVQAARITAGREVVASRTLLSAKKKYSMFLIDLDGNPCSKLKTMGLDLIKSTTPPKIRDFLNTLLLNLLKHGHSETQLAKFILEFKHEFHNNFKPLDFGDPKGVNGISDYKDRMYLRDLHDRNTRNTIMSTPLTKRELKALITAEKDAERWAKIIKGKKVTVPGHVRSAINFNNILDELGDKITPRILSGTKIRSFYLKTNKWNITSIAISSDLDDYPDWFLELPFDMNKIEETLINKKVASLYNPIGWKVPKLETEELENTFGF